jgi:hypothetical protein
MNKLEEIFIQLKKINDIYSELNTFEILNSIEENKVLKAKIEELELEVNKNKDIIKSKNEEIANFTKSSLLSSMDKQISEHKNYIAILEKKLNMRQKIETEPSKNEIISNLTNNKETKEEESKEEANLSIPENKEENNEENKENKEYEIISDGKKKYYLIKKKVYRINKDKSIGNYYGKYKNGEILKSD